MLNLPLIEERYGKAFFASIGLHALLAVSLLAAPFLMPDATPIQIGTGPGGGTGGDPYTVGVADDLGGGAGLFKPALTPQPAAPPPKSDKEAIKKEDPKAIPIPESMAKKKKADAARSPKQTPTAASNQIPDAEAKGAGGAGGTSRGSGGGAGGGVGVSIGSGSGGIGDSWYARVVEARIGSNWEKPIYQQQRIEIIYTFVVAVNGTIYDIQLEKSSGNLLLDQRAERAIKLSSPLLQPPPELRGRPLQFMTRFVYPPDK